MMLLHISIIVNTNRRVCGSCLQSPVPIHCAPTDDYVIPHSSKVVLCMCGMQLHGSRSFIFCHYPNHAMTSHDSALYFQELSNSKLIQVILWVTLRSVVEIMQWVPMLWDWQLSAVLVHTNNPCYDVTHSLIVVTHPSQYCSYFAEFCKSKLTSIFSAHGTFSVALCFHQWLLLTRWS